MHLPIAPQCNLQCGYCSRKFDCVNESRPGVTSRLMADDEVLPAVENALRQYPIHVIGIAGPGDPLADPSRTFRVLRMLKVYFPEMILCLSTNGLALADAAEEIADIGLEYLTVTVNAADPVIGAGLYEFVNGPGGKLRKKEAAEFLLEQQTRGLEKLSGRHIHLKINTVCIPEVNLQHIPEISAFAAAHGAELHNIIPLIPVPGTAMGGMRPPGADELSAVRAQARKYLPVMTHCVQCRADAAGFLTDGRQ